VDTRVLNGLDTAITNASDVMDLPH
jgi:hypothetical protein